MSLFKATGLWESVESTTLPFPRDMLLLKLVLLPALEVQQIQYYLNWVDGEGFDNSALFWICDVTVPKQI